MRAPTFLSAATALALAAPAGATTQSLILDFGTTEDSTFNTAGDLEIRFRAVAEGVNATLTASTAFETVRAGNNGSVNGDLRVNMAGGSGASFVLTLFDAGPEGDGFSELYDPGTEYQWSLAFYDLDGTSGGSDAYHDEIVLLSSGVYLLTTTTEVAVDETSDPGGVRFSGEPTRRDVPGQNGLPPVVTQEQADAAVAVTMTNESSVTFRYEVVDATGAGRGRNLLVDGGSLLMQMRQQPSGTVSRPTPSTPDDYPGLPVVPLPAGLPALAGALGLLALLRRRR